MVDKTYYISGSCVYTKLPDGSYEAFGCAIHVDGLNLIVHPYDQTLESLIGIPEENIEKLEGEFKTKYS